MHASGRAQRDERGLRERCVEICRLIYDRGYTTGNDGNVSVRLGARHLLVTPSGVHKGFLQPSDLVKTDLSGRPAPGERGRPTSELGVHVAVYQARSDARAVVHAHPTSAVAASIAGVDLADVVVPEVVFGVGTIPTVPYTTPTTDDVPRAVLEYAAEHEAMVLARHGTLTFGPDLLSAFARLETIEHTARIVCLARMLGPVAPLPDAEVARLRRVAGRDDGGGEEIEALVAAATRAVLDHLARRNP